MEAAVIPQPLLDQVQTMVNKKSLHQQTISELLLIHQQNDLILEISRNEKMPKSSILSTELSSTFLDSTENYLGRSINMSLSCIDLKKELSVTKDQQSLSLSQALSEIQKACSRKTYDVVRDRINRRQFYRKERKFEKEKSYNGELSKKCLKLSEQVIEYESKIKALEEKIHILSEKDRKMAAWEKRNFQMEENLIRMEKSILYKEKMLAGTRKKLSQQSHLLEEEKTKNEHLKESISSIIQRFERSNSNKCSRKCWKGELFEKCKQNLETRKRLMEIQQEVIEKHYLDIKEIAEKIKREVK